MAKTEAVVVLALLAAALCVGCATSPMIANSPATAEEIELTLPWRGPAADVVERAIVLHDTARDRDVPLRAYIPNSPAPIPLVVFSHGIGESRDAYRYFGLGVASRGYAVVHLQHAGTDAEVLKRGYLNLYREIKKPENWRNRPIDVVFVLDEIIGARSGIAELDGRIDPERIAVAGHSAGAFTSMAMTGMLLGESAEEVRDPRVRAAIALSMPRLDGVLREDAFTRIAVPVLHVTGRRDSSIIYRTRPRHRRVAFDQTTAGDQVLVTLARGAHATFSNVWNAANQRQTKEQRLVLEFSVAFLDAYLRSDPRALQWLESSGEQLRDVARVEKK